MFRRIKRACQILCSRNSKHTLRVCALCEKAIIPNVSCVYHEDGTLSHSVCYEAAHGYREKSDDTIIVKAPETNAEPISEEWRCFVCGLEIKNGDFYMRGDGKENRHHAHGHCATNGLAIAEIKSWH